MVDWTEIDVILAALVAFLTIIFKFFERFIKLEEKVNRLEKDYTLLLERIINKGFEKKGERNDKK